VKRNMHSSAETSAFGLRFHRLLYTSSGMNEAVFLISLVEG
jgi:hypothetical protein